MLDEHVEYGKDSVALRLFRIQNVANIKKKLHTFFSILEDVT